MRDNQPKHRQAAKERRRLDRRRASLDSLATALVVCEGQCTEPNYLRGLTEHLRVNQANVEIRSGGNKTDARGLVRHAHDLFRRHPDFDRVFVVVDGDQHHLAEAEREAALPMRKAGGGSVCVEMVINRPCFEFWLLLHFEYTTAAMTSAQALQALRGNLPEYAKEDPLIFAKVQAGLHRAEGYAIRVSRDVADSGGNTPGSNMPVLIEALRAMRRGATP